MYHGIIIYIVMTVLFSLIFGNPDGTVYVPKDCYFECFVKCVTDFECNPDQFFGYVSGYCFSIPERIRCREQIPMCKSNQY